MSPPNTQDDTDDETIDETTTCTFRATVMTEDGELKVTTLLPDGTTSGDTANSDVSTFTTGE